MQWPSKCVRPSNLIMAISCYSDFSNSLLGAATGTGYWLKLQVGWARLGVREGDQPASQSPDATPPPPHTPFFSPPHTFYKHTNMEQVDTDSFVCSFHWDPLNRAGSVEHRGKIRIVKWRRGTSLSALLFSYLHVSLWPGACVWGVMRRGPRRGDKRKSDGGQAAALLAALMDLPPPPCPPSPLPSPPTGCPGHRLFAQGDK